MACQRLTEIEIEFDSEEHAFPGVIKRDVMGLMNLHSGAQPLRPLLLLLLPGLDGTGELFRWLLSALPEGINPIVVSYPRDTGADYAALEAHVGRLLPQDQPFAILGESFSGPLVLRIAANRPENLVAVILVASFVKQPIGWISGAAACAFRPVVFRFPVPRLLLRWLLLGGNPPSELIKGTVDSLASIDAAILAGRARAALTVDATEALIHCPVPILYLGGRQDRLVSPRMAERLKPLRPGLECAMIDAPHFVLQRSPAAATAIITEFLGRHRPRNVDKQMRDRPLPA